MKKTLLLAAFAMAGMVSAQAFEVGDYVYTKTQRLKISGENLVQNGNFAEGFSAGGWCSAAADGIVNQGVWTVVDGIGPNGEAAVQSQGATADEALCNVWAGLEGGQTYVVSFDIKGESAGTTTVGTTVGANYADFFLNGDGSLAHAASTDEAPVVNVATATSFSDEWTTVSYVLTPDQGQMLVMHFERLTTGVAITNFSLHQADEVFDDRIARKKLAWADKLLADPNFNTDEAAGAKEEFMGVYAAVAEDLENGGETAGEYMDAFDELLGYYMDATTDNMATENNFKYVTDLTKFPKRNRKDLKANRQEGGFMFRQVGATDGGETNWQHPNGGDYFSLAIQGTFSNNAGSVALYSTSMPAGKYYIAAEMRNAYMDGKYNRTYTMEKTVKGFIGNDSIDLGTIVGEDYTKFYFVKELKEGETFEAGFFWEGHNAGSAFDIKGFECRAFGDLAAEAERAAVWEKFIAQYNAVVSAREALIAMQSDKNYPWAKDSLDRALAQWDPYFNATVAKGWVSADGKDTRVATLDELTDWTTYHGVELYDETGALLKYQLVRGYQNATNYVKEENKAVTDLRDEIDAAWLKYNDDLNTTGDKATFKAAIDAAQAIVDNVKENSTDATREADEVTLQAGVETLKAAEEAFLATVIPPYEVANIDFSNGFEAIVENSGEEGAEDVVNGYAIKGAKNQMEFTLASVTANEDGTFANDKTTFALGCGGAEAVNTDVLRIGKGTATVNFAEGDVPADDDVIRVTFDAWFGALVNRSVNIQLQNAAGERVAGFDYCLYGGTTNYNDFNNAAGNGLNIAAYGVSTGKDANAVILADKYKWSFDLIVDYKALALQAMLTTSPKGAANGGRVPMNTTLTDNKIAKFVITSNYDNADRRSWFDNLKIVKYKSQAAGPIVDGIATVDNAVKPATGAIYNLMGVRLNSKPAKGLYIMDGKKYMAK